MMILFMTIEIPLLGAVHSDMDEMEMIEQSHGFASEFGLKIVQELWTRSIRTWNPKSAYIV